MGKPGSRWLCDYPPYGRGGHLDSRYILSTSEPDGPPQVAYGPQLQWLPQGAGPKHYMSLPVNRSSVAPVQGPDSTTVNITLRMSSVSPAQMFWLGGNSHVGLPNVNVTASEHEANSAHSSWEITCSYKCQPSCSRLTLSGNVWWRFRGWKAPAALARPFGHRVSARVKQYIDPKLCLHHVGNTPLTYLLVHAPNINRYQPHINLDAVGR